MAGTVPPSFVDHGPKLRIRMIAIGDWPEMAKKTGRAPEKHPYLGNVDFFQGGNFFGVVPGVLMICPFDQKLRFQTKN